MPPRQTTTAKEIVRQIETFGPRTVKELVDELLLHHQTIRGNLRYLESQNKVERLGTYPVTYGIPKEPEVLTLESPELVFDRDRIDTMKKLYTEAHPDDNDLAGTIKRMVKQNKNNIPKALFVLSEWAQALKEVGEKKNGNESAELGD